MIYLKAQELFTVAAVDVGVKSVLCVGQVSCCGYNDLAGDMVTGHTATTVAATVYSQTCLVLS